MTLTVSDIMRMMPSAQQKRVNEFILAINDTLQKYEINTPLRIAHFIAQIGHESLSLIYTEEIANGFAYENRRDLGNVFSGDGRRFKGRGVIQITGRANYKAYSDYLASRGGTIDFCATPLSLANLPYCIDSAGWFWTAKMNLNKYADKDDLNAITKRINGGTNGILDRKKRLDLAKSVLNSKV